MCALFTFYHAVHHSLSSRAPLMYGSKRHFRTAADENFFVVRIPENDSKEVWRCRQSRGYILRMWWCWGFYEMKELISQFIRLKHGQQFLVCWRRVRIHAIHSSTLFTKCKLDMKFYITSQFKEKGWVTFLVFFLELLEENGKYCSERYKVWYNYIWLHEYIDNCVFCFFLQF